MNNKLKTKPTAKDTPKTIGANEGLGIRGHVKAWITDNKTGKKRLVVDDHNAIHANYGVIIADALVAPTNYAIDAPFLNNANPPTNAKDGICIKDNGTGNWYGMIMAANVVSIGGAGAGVSSIKFAGTFTGLLITVANAADVKLGHNWSNAAPNDFISDPGGANAPYTNFANPSTPAWTSQTVQVAETLTIEWTIYHQST